MDIPLDMQHQAMGYDRTATMFSPDGHLLQVEYAEKAARLGSASIGMVCKDGVFILADGRIDDKLIRRESLNKISEIDENIIGVSAGISSDARILIERAQLIAQQHRITYDTPIEPETIIREIANIKQQFSQYGGTRPFGVSIMIAGIKSKKPELFVSDVTGNYLGYYASSIGENDERIKEELRGKYKEDLTIKQGVKIALEIFKKMQEKKFDINRFELAYIENENEKIIRKRGKEIEEIK